MRLRRHCGNNIDQDWWVDIEVGKFSKGRDNLRRHMAARSSLSSREFASALAVLKREQSENMPSPRQELHFHLFNWSVFSFLGCSTAALVIGYLVEEYGSTNDLEWVGFFLLGVPAILGLSIVVLFFLNLKLMWALRRQARSRRRLGLVKNLKGLFKAKRRRNWIRNAFTMFVVFLGVILVPIGLLSFFAFAYFLDIPEALLFSLAISVLGLSLVFLHFMRRGKQRLEIVMRMHESLSEHKETFESDHESAVDISSADYDKIASIERAHIITDRAKSIEMARKESLDSSYVIQKSREMLGAKAALDLDARVRVDDQIFHLVTNPLPPGVTEDPGTGYLRLSVPETSVDILYQVDEQRHRIRLLALQSSAEPADLNP